MAGRKLRIFISYARKDRELLDRLIKHLAPLEDEGLIEHWTDLAIEPGDRWDERINAELDSADIILLLISADFLASRYIRTVELKRALDREARREAVVIPVILRPAEWEKSAIGHLQALPTGGRAVTKWGNRDDAFLSIEKGVREVAIRLHRDLESADTSAGRVDSAFAASERAAQERVAPEERVLDAAIAKKIPLGKPSDLTVMIRESGSSGLKAILGQDDEYSSNPEDVRSKPFEITFPRDERGQRQPAMLQVQIEAPDFEPGFLTAQIAVPPQGDSAVYPFLLTPLFPGELVINVRVYSAEGQQIARILRIISEASDRVVSHGRVLTSIPISASEAAANMSGSPVVAAPPAPPPPRTHPSPGALPAPPARARRRFTGKPYIYSAAAGLLVVVGVGYFTGSGEKPYVAYQPVASTPSINLSHEDDIARLIGPPLSSWPPEIHPQPAKSIAPVLFFNDYRKASEAAQRGDLKTAARYYQFAADRTEVDDEFRSLALSGLATADLALADEAPLTKRQDYLNSAVSVAQKMAELKPESGHSWYLTGIALDRSGNLQEAETAFRKATALEPSTARNWDALGRVLSKAKKPDDAAKALEQAVKLDPQNVDARLLLAATLLPSDPLQAKQQLTTLKGNKSITGTKLTALNRLNQRLAAAEPPSRTN